MIGKLPTGEKDSFQCRYDRPFDRRIISHRTFDVHSILYAFVSTIFHAIQLVSWIIFRRHLTRVSVPSFSRREMVSFEINDCGLLPDKNLESFIYHVHMLEKDFFLHLGNNLAINE